MNKYNVIHVDVSTFWDSYKDNLIEKYRNIFTKISGVNLEIS